MYGWAPCLVSVKALFQCVDGPVGIWGILSHVIWRFVCFVCLQALTVFIIFSLVSLVGVSVCCARSYVMSSLFGGFPGLVGDSVSAFFHISFDCFPLYPHLHSNYLSPFM